MTEEDAKLVARDLNTKDAFAFWMALMFVITAGGWYYEKFINVCKLF
jgi:hypothetical protein